MLIVANAPGLFTFEKWRGGKLIDVAQFSNGITNEGANKQLDVGFRAQAAITTWYIGLINNTGTPSLAAGDTHASHAGWSELYSEYSQSVRPTWTPSAASGRVIANATPVTFDFTTTAPIYGAFLASLSTKGSVSGSGIIWATGAYTTPATFGNGDSLKVTYQTSL